MCELQEGKKNDTTVVVCEGEETRENMSLLKQSECDIFQGYYFYKPFPLEELETAFLSQATEAG